VRVACVEKVLADLCLELDSTSCLVALNHCVHTNQTNVRKLQNYIEKHAHTPGIRRLARLLPLVNVRCESPLETLAWLSIYRSKLILPNQQVVIPLPEGSKPNSARVDMYWKLETMRLVVELDGKIKYQNPDDIYKEKIREDRLRGAGYKVLRYLWNDVRNEKMITQLKAVGVTGRRNFGRKIPVW